MRSHLFILFSTAIAFGVLLRKLGPTPRSCRVFPTFSCKSLKVSGCRFRSFIHVDWILVYGDRCGSISLFLQAISQLSQQHLLKRPSHLLELSLVFLSKINWLYLCGFPFGASILFHWSSFLSLCQYQAVLITTSDFSVETLQARRDWTKIFQVLKQNNCQPRITYPAKISFVYENEIRYLHSKKKLEEYVNTKPVL